MNMIFHKAETRGHANHGWLNSYHTFSFAGYHHPERIHFGALRVLNDDTVAPGMGFGTHPHDNMEIISIPLSGDLKHKDSMGNETVIKQGDVQVMSAGTGIYHSEMNANKDKEVKFLQIWVFPNKQNVQPRYGQVTLNTAGMKNNLLEVVSPYQTSQGVWIYQDAWFSMGNLEKGFSTLYKLNKSNNGVYAFVLEGSVMINNQVVSKRDGLGITDEEEFSIAALSDTSLLLMEVPMMK